MFKVVKPEYTNKTFRMPTELVKSLGQIAHDMGVSMNNLVVQCCEYAIANIGSAENENRFADNTVKFEALRAGKPAEPADAED
jgi:uncharacterized protein with GYD domain